ncbi:MAG: ElyC/SanA/YdcF family protein [Acidobacteriota bacterium]
MMHRADVLCISSIDWDFIWQGHQEIMSTLAADGHRVLFIENTGVRGPALGDFPRVRKRVLSWWRATKGFREERPNLFLFSPLLLPFPYSRVARWVNRFFILRALRRWMRVTGFHRPIVWTFLPTPLALDLIDAIDPQLTIYYCIDDLASSSPGARRIVSSEERLFREADLVFVTSEKLRARAARVSPRVSVFPFGVSFDRFETTRASDEPLPADVSALSRPVVGYVGGLHQWVDQDLLAAVAARMPEVAFALVGPAQTDVSRLARCPNVHLLGQRPHPQVPAYIKAFDVGLVPYKLAEYTANVYPTKLNEYLVMGKPVVATDLPEIRRFNADHGEVVRIAGDAAAFEAAVRSALAERASDLVPRRIAVAQANSWQSRIAAMKVLIDAALDTRASSDQGWDAALRRVYRRARGHTAQLVLGAAAVYLLVFYTNLAWWCAEPLRFSAAPVKADAIVVFAGGVGESGKAGGGHQERVKRAVDLYKAGYADVLVLSSGFVYSFKEAEVMRALAIDQGIPAGQIVLEEHATNTHENVTYVSHILHDRKWMRILLVSSPYHMRRALLVWRKVAPDVDVVPTPPEKTQFYEHTQGASLEQIRGILWEYLATFSYWRRGWL